MIQYNKLIPELLVSNLKLSLEFYIKIAGFRIEYSRERPAFSFLSREGSQLMLEEIEPKDSWITDKLERPFGRGVNFQIEVSDADSLYKTFKNTAVRFFRNLEESTYKVDQGTVRLKQFVIFDPDGYLLRFSQRIK